MEKASKAGSAGVRGTMWFCAAKVVMAKLYW